MPTLTVEVRFCGPPGAANGGYLAGLLSRCADAPVRVRLERPVPLGTALDVIEQSEGLDLCRDGMRLARAEPVHLDLRPPAAPDYLEALEASRHYVGFGRHAFPACFVCGIDRARGDGLRIFAGPIETRQLVAAPWVPAPDLDRGDGRVRPEFMWAALDCPGYFAARSDSVPMLLGEFSAHVDRRVHVDEPCVVIGWRIAAEGRKHTVGTALFDEDGELCARAQALWIEPRAPASGVREPLRREP
jgi:hypothetical protein